MILPCGCDPTKFTYCLTGVDLLTRATQTMCAAFDAPDDDTFTRAWDLRLPNHQA